MMDTRAPRVFLQIAAPPPHDLLMLSWELWAEPWAPGVGSI